MQRLNRFLPTSM